MSQIVKTAFKPRYHVAYLTKSKIWSYKNAYLRRFFEIRARRRQRVGLFRRNVLVAKTRKWIIARRYIQPFRRRSNSKITGGSSKAFGRLKKSNYIKIFYFKQQLRSFYGKRKEKSFQQIFQCNRQFIGRNSISFFNVLESRLDRVFFRRHLFPTIFSCHQYIHHQGLLINGKLEKSPRYVVKIGDILSFSKSVWNSFYWDLFCRVYYRRWGSHILRRRLFTSVKKNLFNFAIDKSQNPFFFRFRQKKITTNSDFHSNKVSKNDIDNSFSYYPTFQSNQKKVKGNLYFTKKKKIKYSSKIIYPVERKLLFSQLNSFFNSNKEFDINEIDILDTLFINNFFDKFNGINSSNQIQKNFYNFRLRFFFSFNKINPSIFDTNSIIKKANIQNREFNSFNRYQNLKDFDLKENWKFFKKFSCFQKVFFSRRLYKKSLPFIRNTYKKYSKTPVINKGISFRTLIKYQQTRWRKKKIRRRKLVRLKAVHLYFPSHIQRDFRTLRAIKIESPSINNIYYPFRGSVEKIYSFYRSRGF